MSKDQKEVIENIKGLEKRIVSQVTEQMRSIGTNQEVKREIETALGRHTKQILKDHKDTKNLLK